MPKFQNCIQSNTDNCTFNFLTKYSTLTQGEFKSFIYFRVKHKKLLFNNNLNKTLIFDQSISLDHFLNKNLEFLICNLFSLQSTLFNIISIDLNQNLLLKSECFKHSILDNYSILLWSLLISITLTLICFNTLLIFISSLALFFSTLLVSVLIYNQIGHWLDLDTFKTFSVFNLLSLLAFFLINLSDSFLISTCYTQSHKLNSNANLNLNTRSIKILKNTFRQAFYFLIPKNFSFLFILFVCYLNQIEFIQKFAVFTSILLVVYILIGLICYMCVILFLSDYHHKFWFTHQVKIFDIDLNKFIKNIFSKYLPWLIEKCRFFWFWIFTISSLFSLMAIFYYPCLNIGQQEPKLDLVDNAFGDNLIISIVWGSQIEDYSNVKYAKNQRYNLEILLDSEMESQAYKQFEILFEFCKELNANNKQQEISIRKTFCFVNNFENYLNKSVNIQNIKNLQKYKELMQIQDLLQTPAIQVYEKDCDPIRNDFKSNPKYSNYLNKKLYLYCIKFWSLKMFEYELLSDSPVHTGPLYLHTRTLPNLFLIQLETDLKFTRDYKEMHNQFNRIDHWWKSMVNKYYLNENLVWWTSNQFSNYFMQKKLTNNSFSPV